MPEAIALQEINSLELALNTATERFQKSLNLLKQFFAVEPVVEPTPTTKIVEPTPPTKVEPVAEPKPTVQAEIFDIDFGCGT